MKDSVETVNKFFGLSEAYFAAAETLARESTTKVLPNPSYLGSACMFNARLGVELFLKGMIVLRNPSAKIGGHVLETHTKTFATLYPEPECEWQVPFTAQVISETADARNKAIEDAIKNRPLDQVFRYPSDNKGHPWELVTNLDFQWFMKFLSGILNDIQRIKSGAGL